MKNTTIIQDKKELKNINNKKFIIKNKKEKIQEKINKKNEDLNEWIIDISETERQEQKTAQKISETLQDIIDTQNNNAKGYLKDFKEWLEEKFNHKIRKKYFPGKTKEDILILATKDKDTKNKLSNYRKECEQEKGRKEIYEEKKRIFEAIKRAFNKNITGHKRTDIDKKSGLKLLQLAKFFTDVNGKKTKYTIYEVENQERAKKGVQYDSGGTRNGIEIIPNKQNIGNGKSEGKTYQSLFNALIIGDEHNKSDGAKNIMKPTSSTHIIYTLLNELHAFNPKHKEQIKRFVDFVDKVDSQYYQFGGKDEKAKTHTLFHNHKSVSSQNIYNYFKDKTKTGFEILNDQELKNLGIHNTIKEENNSKKNKEMIEKLEKQGRFGNLDKNKFIFAIGKELDSGQKISSNYYSGIVQLFKSGDLYIYSPTPLPEKIAGFTTNGNFLIIKKISSEDLKKILDSFDFNPECSDPLLKETFLKYQKERNEINPKLAQKEKENKENKEITQEKVQKEIQNLKEKKINIGDIMTGVINNISGKIMYINITPNLVGIIKNDTKKTELKPGEKIQVIIADLAKKDENKYIFLKKVI